MPLADAANLGRFVARGVHCVAHFRRLVRNFPGVVGVPRSAARVRRMIADSKFAEAYVTWHPVISSTIQILKRTHEVCPYSNATRGNIEVTLKVV